MGAGFGLLRLAPDAFWRMTPRELAAAVRALLPVPRDALSRTDLDALMRRFPDPSR
ncbi:rcc01693 family protein [Xanthobacter sp. AM11]|uniref:rcc01693 family protein n=1 Tax=Xanthobacter sp. AM11 TaxID=3380643 RepID=UPI0039BF73EE